MAMAGTYVTDVPLKGKAEKHYKRWRSEHNLFPDAIGHHIQGVAVHEGDWETHGSIKLWNYTLDGKEEIFKERTDIDDEKMVVTINGLEGHVMEELKVFVTSFLFIPTSEEGCVCKITMTWEKRNEDSPEPINYMKFVEKMVDDMDEHILQDQE